MPSAKSIDTLPFDLRAIRRSSSPNDALACPPGVCAAKADVSSQIFAVPVADLMALAESIILAEPRTEVAARDQTRRQVVFVQRSRVFGFADTIRLQADGTDGAASALLYSKSNVGYWDFGVNLKRVRRIVAEITRRMSNGTAAPSFR
ncbi:MAG: DUF1499 domain-containing protein [Rhodospirillaceae bacterium]